MSRGPGRIERAIRELFHAGPSDYGGIGIDELARHCYPGVGKIERKHQVAVLRAANKVIAGDPAWTKFRGWDATVRNYPVGYTEFFRRDNPPGWVRNDWKWKRSKDGAAFYTLSTPHVAENATLTPLRSLKPPDLEERAARLRAMLDAKRCLPGSGPEKETLTGLAARARALMVQNDPDAVRDGLREIADALDRLGGRAAPILDEAAD